MKVSIFNGFCCELVNELDGKTTFGLTFAAAASTLHTVFALQTLQFVFQTLFSASGRKHCFFLFCNSNHHSPVCGVKLYYLLFIYTV